MRKIRLELDTLAVDSFETAGTATDGGTVMAHSNPSHGPNCGSAYDACQTGLCTLDCGAA